MPRVGDRLAKSVIIYECTQIGIPLELSMNLQLKYTIDLVRRTGLRAFLTSLPPCMQQPFDIKVSFPV